MLRDHRATQAGVDLPAPLRAIDRRGHFPPATETEFRVWLRDEVSVLVRVLFLLSVPIWVAIPFATSALLDAPTTASLYWISLGISVPLLALGLVAVGSSRVGPRLLTGTIATIIAILGINAMLLPYSTIGETSQGGVLGALIWFSSLAAFLRLPFWETTLAAVGIGGTGAVLLLVSVRELDTPASVAWPYAVLIVTTLLLTSAMGYFGEYTMRSRFLDDRLLALQREALADSQRQLRRYAPATVVSRIEEGDTSVDQPRRRRVTVFSSDMVGFTALADRLDPEDLADIINEYVAGLSDLVDAHGGTVTEFAGDGLTAIFGAPDEQPPAEQVRAALAVAEALHESLVRWAEPWFLRGITEPPQARVGINTGIVSVGTFGSAVRGTYTGIGLQVNIAARIQAHAEPGSTLLSSTSWHLIKDTVSCEPYGEVMVKGVHFPIEMYRPASD